MDIPSYQLDVSNNNDIKNISMQIERLYGRQDILVIMQLFCTIVWQDAIDADFQVVNRS